MKEDWIYKRGDLYYANLNPYFGSEQGGTRPVLVLQNNVGNFFCPTLIVAPLTSKWIKKKELPTHYALESVPELGLKSVVLLEQIKTIDKRRVLSYIGRVSREEMRAIDDALQVSLDIHIPEEMEAPYSHIIDEDRCINAQRLEEAFYSSKTPDPVEDTEPKTADTAVTESDESDAAKILELLKNPETAALLKQLAKAL